MAEYCSLFSSSKGNCTYVGTTSGGILVDVGVSAKRVREALEARGIDPCSIKGICITHEHSDHIAGLRVLTKQFGWTVYASEGTLSALLEEGQINPKSDLVPLRTAAVTIGDLEVTPFHTPHDSRESLGFCVQTPDERKIGIATDMGVMRKEVETLLSACDLVHIESNHDIAMLRAGAYPLYLQERILSDRGHLSNVMCARSVANLAKAGVSRFVLAHLSEQNNTPSLATETALAALSQEGMQNGKDYLLGAAAPISRRDVTRL